MADDGAKSRPAPSPMASPIVSSAHLAGDAAALSEMEYGLIVAMHAFDRWIVRCAAAAGVPDLAPLDVLILHSINHRGREKRLADLTFVLNIEDTHLVSYACKKLEKLGLVVRDKRGKEVVFSVTEAGADACRRYGEIRAACLVDTVKAIGTIDLEDLSAQGRLLRALSGLYDQAARSASSL